MNKIQPYWNKDHTAYAILIGGGYCSWVVVNCPEFAYDSRIVEYVLPKIDNPKWRTSFSLTERMKIYKGIENKNIARLQEYLISLGYNHPEVGGAENLKVVWMPAGKKWQIIDGGECTDHLMIMDEQPWISFE